MLAAAWVYVPSPPEKSLAFSEAGKTSGDCIRQQIELLAPRRVL
jgi:hypothetical protein